MNLYWFFSEELDSWTCIAASDEPHAWHFLARNMLLGKLPLDSAQDVKVTPDAAIEVRRKQRLHRITVLTQEGGLVAFLTATVHPHVHATEVSGALQAF